MDKADPRKGFLNFGKTFFHWRQCIVGAFQPQQQPFAFDHRQIRKGVDRVVAEIAERAAVTLKGEAVQTDTAEPVLSNGSDPNPRMRCHGWQWQFCSLLSPIHNIAACAVPKPETGSHRSVKSGVALIVKYPNDSHNS